MLLALECSVELLTESSSLSWLQQQSPQEKEGVVLRRVDKALWVQEGCSSRLSRGRSRGGTTPCLEWGA